MEIIKSTPSTPRKCEFGDFELKPEKGWKLSQTFIDFESKLLIVSVLNEDRSTWTSDGYGSSFIPGKEYKVDLNTLRIINFDDWKKYFNYEKTETISDDKKYKLITQRVHEPERNSDGIKEELYDLQSGERISRSDSIAFDKDKRENLLEGFYRRMREKEEQQRILDAKLTLEQFYHKQLGELKGNVDILCYLDENDNTYRLSFCNSGFELSEGGKLPVPPLGWKSISFKTTKIYNNADAYWKDLTADNKWFLKFTVHQGVPQKPLVLAKHIITSFNNLRKENKFTIKEYDKIFQWFYTVRSDDYRNTEIKQWCSNCFKEVEFRQNYPKYICEECKLKKMYDSKGNILEFSNIGALGGLHIECKDGKGKLLWEDKSSEYCECIIDNKLFFVKEGRYGGIVIELKD